VQQKMTKGLTRPIRQKKIRKLQRTAKRRPKSLVAIDRIGIDADARSVNQKVTTNRRPRKNYVRRQTGMHFVGLRKSMIGFRDPVDKMGKSPRTRTTTCAVSA
jgi:hypothetical protein